MTKVDFLDSITAFTIDAVKDLLLPVRRQESSEEREMRPAIVYKMALPDASASTKKAPYILHQIVTSDDVQPEGGNTESTLQLRSVFCVYDDDTQEGSLYLLELMERLRIALLKRRVLSSRYELSLRTAMQSLVYPDNTAPYFLGEMFSVWRLPSIEREVRPWL